MLNYAPHSEDVLGNGGIAPNINFGSTAGERSPSPAASSAVKTPEPIGQKEGWDLKPEILKVPRVALPEYDTEI
jgi:hypothetical protein